MEFMSKFLLKFLWWCISHELMNPGSMPGGGARGQNLGHLYFGSKFWFKFHW